MKLRRLPLALVLVGALLLSCGATAFAEPTPFYLRVLVGEKSATVRAYQNEYVNDLYLSLSDLSAVLSGTPHAFRFAYNYTNADGEYFIVTTGQNATVTSGAGNATESPWVSSLTTFRNRIFVDGLEHRYYTYRDGKDLFMSLADIQLMLDIPIELHEDGLRLYPGQRFRADVPALDELGWFDCFSAVLLGDADTGEILYARCGEVPVPIASISKLMTYLILAEAAKAGEISFNDTVVVSDAAAALSQGPDAMVSLKAGASLPFRELVQVMLLASSNESALALAEHCAGSEAAFVARMEQRAAELGMDSARFYDCHGLPVYLRSAVTAKVQNRMSAQDLFTLCRAVLEECPEILQISSERYGSMPSLNYVTANSNAVVFNLEGCNGLKTGSTNKAGSCLAATLPVTVDGETHTAVAIVLGAEIPALRNQAAEILLRYARDTWTEEGFPAAQTVLEPVEEPAD
ncbi:MAG: D-alanyl-D-alanine carboxypeptidase, partial [Oscillospiraceae bacterium]|nr:D-alanyl-D-alanine carboxypeptidase [Oscillospiraceae bacterium]